LIKTFYISEGSGSSQPEDEKESCEMRFDPAKVKIFSNCKIKNHHVIDFHIPPLIF
jgi:hypothetical protein